MTERDTMTWQAAEVASPLLTRPVPVVAARNIATVPGGNRLQNLHLYLPRTPDTAALIGHPVASLPGAAASSTGPRFHVHVHGGAWRDPHLTATSIEAAVACAFADPAAAAPITAVASINYTLTHFPTHPTLPYDVATAGHADPAREAVHPQHLADVLRSFARLRSLGLADRSYILTGHSCGACLVLQAILQSPSAYDLDEIADAPCPAAIVGLNGLYDLPALVHGLGASHEHLRPVYETLLANAFGADEPAWAAASPALFDPDAIAARASEGWAPRLIVLDQSAEDQLVPMNQRDRLAARLGEVDGLRMAQGERCTGTHAAPWEDGIAIWRNVRDALELLQAV